MTDLSPYFEGSRWARGSVASDIARARGALFSICAVIIDTLHIPALVRWIANRLEDRS